MKRFKIDENNNFDILDRGIYYTTVESQECAEDYCRLLNLEVEKKIVDNGFMSIRKTDLVFLIQQLNVRPERKDENEIARICNLYF